MPLWLAESDVHACLPMRDLVEAMAPALANFSSGRAMQPVRAVLEYQPGSFFGSMPAYDPSTGFVGAKLLTVLPGNLAKGLPSHQALIVLFDAEGGELLAVTDGRYITEARTAAVTAVSVRHLARPDAKVLTILGSGVQAHSHLQALPLVRDFTEIRVWSPTRERLERFVAQAGPLVHAARSAEAAVRGADVIALVTSSREPVIDNSWVADGAHVIAAGACRYNFRETDTALMQRALIVVDSRAAALVEAGDILLSHTQDRIHAELGEIVAGTKPGRTSDAQVTVFKSLGLAIEDVVSAGLAYRRALDSGRGIQVPM